MEPWPTFEVLAETVSAQLVINHSSSDNHFSSKLATSRQYHFSPTINWPLALQRAGCQADLAHDLLCLLVKSLPQVILRVQRLIDGFKDPDIGSLIHKLHGSTLYSGVPRLSALCCFLETQLQLGNHPHTLTAVWSALLAECHAVEHQAVLWLTQPSNSTVATA
ncbi:MAG: Hpt domain-containing protein [Candidatus Symbiodolus clandestinus]